MSNAQMKFMVGNEAVRGFEKERKDILKERINTYGIASLLNFEALSFLTGIKEEELRKFENLQDLREEIEMLNATDLQKQKLKAFFTMAVRYSQERRGEITKISSPSDVANLLMDDMKHLKKEYFKIVILDTKNQVISVEQISEGTLNSSLVHPREAFKPAIQRSASAIILCHNHPSQIANPSNEDINISKRLIEAGKIIGISVLDHVIIGGDKYYSLKEEGLI
ncbi:JAB domain-containing protein [Brassicibacter mesophilus]|uniref:JAB domain-containing protein n=1 Tax=Brassicibacter mesophilus TaxID=745119 RepID=UPI003D19EA21